MPFNPVVVILFILATVVLYFSLREKPKVSPGEQVGRKSSYGDELIEARLFSLITMSPIVTFVEVQTVEIFEEDGGIEIITGSISNQTTNVVRLNEDTILIATGHTMPCEWGKLSHIRFFFLGFEVYEEKLYGCEVDTEMITGYRDDGSDVCLLFNRNLNVVVENC